MTGRTSGPRAGAMASPAPSAPHRTACTRGWKGAGLRDIGGRPGFMK